MITAAHPTAVPYDLSPQFCQAVVYHLATSVAFWECGGQEIRSSLILDPVPQLLVLAVQAVVKDTGAHPGAAGRTLVMQRLHTWSLEQAERPKDPTAVTEYTTGPKNIARDMIRRCFDYLIEADEEQFPSSTAVLRELLPTLKRQLRQEAVALSVRALSPDGELEGAGKKAQELLARVDTLGQPIDKQPSLGLDPSWMDGAARVSLVERMPWDIPELDRLFNGGKARGELGMAVGSTGEGKTFWLIDGWCQALLAPVNAVYATLELDAELVRIRAAANLTGIPINDLVDKNRSWAREEAERRLRWLRDMGALGFGRVRWFPAGVTQLKHILAWVEELQKETGLFIHSIFLDADEHIDYADQTWTDYKGMGKLYAGAREIARGPNPDRFPELKRWVEIASPAKIKANVRDDYIKKIEDAADSARKGRIVDWGVTLNRRIPPGGSPVMVVNVAKDRNADVGVLQEMPTNYACGQVLARVRAFPWHQDKQQWRQMTQVPLLGD